MSEEFTVEQKEYIVTERDCMNGDKLFITHPYGTVTGILQSTLPISYPNIMTTDHEINGKSLLQDTEETPQATHPKK